MMHLKEGVLLSRVLYFIPYYCWFLLMFIFVKYDWLNDSLSLWTYILYSFAVAFILEIIRNRMLEQPAALNKVRIIFYVSINLLLGVPLLAILLLSQLPLKIPNEIVTDFSQMTLMPWQQYVLIGYFSIWFIVNAVILKPSKLTNIILLPGSLLLVILSSWICAIVF